MATVLRSPKGSQSKADHVSPPSGSVGEVDAELGQSGFNEDFDPNANSDAGRAPRKRRKIQTATADSTLDETGNKSVREKRTVARPSRPGKYVAGRRGHLKLMTEIPIDTLHEIFRQLDPVDLLNLSWSSKSLRLVIMEKSARYIWQEAFERLYESSNPPPHCPEDLSLPQYSRFLFNKKCMVCDIANGHWTSWMMRLRACSKCLETDQFDTCNSLLHRDFLSISTKKATYCLSSDIGDLDVEAFFFKEEDAGIQQRRLLKETRMIGERSFRAWEKGCVKNREAELDVIRLERRKAILKKLEGHGWKESEIREMYYGQIPSDLPGLGRAKKLTNKDWQDIEPKLLQRLDSLKANYLSRQKHMRMENRWHAFEATFELWIEKQNMVLGATKNWLTDSRVMPRVADIAILEPFRSTIFGSDTETAEFDVDDIDSITTNWLKIREDLLFSLLPQELKDRYQGEDLMSLRTNVILRFRGRARYTTLDEVYDHRETMWRCGPKDSDDVEIRDMLTENAWEFQEIPAPWNWSNEDLEFDNKAYEIVKDILEFLGLNPYTTTLADLEMYEGEYKCLSCPHGWLFMRCRYSAVDMIDHDVTYHDERWTPAHTRWSEAESDDDEDSDSPFVSVAELMGLM